MKNEEHKRLANTINCIHHWMIESPHGVSDLVTLCILCGETKMLKAAWQDTFSYAYVPRDISVVHHQPRKRSKSKMI